MYMQAAVKIVSHLQNGSVICAVEIASHLPNNHVTSAE